MPVLPPSDAAIHPIRIQLRQRAEAAVDAAEAGQPARRTGRRQLAVGDRAGRRDHLDRAEHAVVVRHVDRQHRLHRGEAHRRGVAPGVVDRALHLRRAAGPVHLHRIAALAHRADQRDRHADIDLVVVDPVGERRLAVRQFRQAVPRQALGVVHRGVHQRDDVVGAVARHQVGHAARGDLAGGELAADVAQHAARHAHVAVDHAEQRGVRLAALVQLQRRDAQALGVDLGAVRRVGAWHAPADIGVVADRRGIGDRPRRRRTAA